MSNIIAGPWRRWIRNKFVCVVDEATDKEVIHWAGFDSSDFPHDVRAIAKLAAAAPDLLTACKEALRLMDGEDWLFDLGEQLKSAIKKAE